MKMEDQIKRTVEEQLANRPSHSGAYERLQRRFRRQQRTRVGGAIAGAAALIVAAAIVVPRLTTSSGEPGGFTFQPPTPTPTQSSQAPSASPAIPASSCVPNCRLVERRNFASPVSNATGITFDGKSLWLMAGNTLTEVDPVTAAVGRQHTVDQVGGNVFGVASDGISIWISVAGDTNRIVRVNPDDGSILRSYSSPSVQGPTDLEFDGRDMWLATGTGEIFLLDPETGGVKRRLQAWPDHHRDHGIAVRAGELWVGGLFEDGVAVQDAATGKLLDRVEDEQGKTIKKEWGTMCFANEQLVLLDRFGITFYDVESAR